MRFRMTFRWLVPFACWLLLASGCLPGENGDSSLSDGDNDAGETPAADGDCSCLDEDCPDNASCDSVSGECRCNEGYESLGNRCVRRHPEEDGDRTESDGDALDGDAEEASPDGDEIDIDGDGCAIDGDAEGEETEVEVEDEDPRPYCAVPQAPALSIVHRGAELAFSCDGEGSIQTAVAAGDAGEPDEWTDGDTVLLNETGTVAIFARLLSDACRPRVFSHVVEVRESYPPPAGQDGSTAVAKDDTAFLGWATEVVSVSFGEEVDESWRKTDKALGPAMGGSFDIVSLGRGGEITLAFDPPIADGPGADFAVFENGFSDTFLELAFVEVSSDGETFLRFDGAYRGDTPLGAYDNHDSADIGSLAGKYRQGQGTPFDLRNLKNRPGALSGDMDLRAVRYVRIVDIVGDGRETDAFGHVIYDPYPTTGSAGFDLDAVGVLNR